MLSLDLGLDRLAWTPDTRTQIVQALLDKGYTPCTIFDLVKLFDLVEEAGLTLVLVV